MFPGHPVVSKQVKLPRTIAPLLWLRRVLLLRGDGYCDTASNLTGILRDPLMIAAEAFGIAFILYGLQICIIKIALAAYMCAG